MPLQETSGAASYDAFGGGVPLEGPLYVENVFSTALYTGNGSSQTITNNINLSGKGGMVWVKGRSGATDNALYDTSRGATKDIVSNSNAAETTQATGLTAFSGDGFSIGSLAKLNTNTALYASWSFRKQPKFFDIVTYTGTGVNRTIPHNLSSVPGCIIIKNLSQAGEWYVYHRELGADGYLRLESSVDKGTLLSIWNNTVPTSTVFSLGDFTGVNRNADSFVAYIFAHDAGGFGLSGTENVVSCGSYVSRFTSESPVISLGYEPQWLLVKNISSVGDWRLFDNLRGVTVEDTDALLRPNQSSNEIGFTNYIDFTSKGFQQAPDIDIDFNQYIYIAIRRGLMKPPTSGSDVFAPVAYTGTNVDNRLVNTGIVTDMVMARIRASSSTGGFYNSTRLTTNLFQETASTAGQSGAFDGFMTPTVSYGKSFSAMNGFGVGNNATTQLNQSSTTQIAYAFRRASGFFDVVCYTGTGTNRTVDHNLAAIPELMIVKCRSTTGGWVVYSQPSGAGKYQYLNNDIVATTFTPTWNNTTPTSSVFTVGTDAETNGSGSTFLAYLFATLANVSKVGSYTGTGTTQVINCGFTGGSRFVLIKRTDQPADWYVWDSARGIISGNDPYLLFNSNAAEVTNTDYIDTASTGFEISSTAPAAINANGGTFIFLAIA